MAVTLYMVCHWIILCGELTQYKTKYFFTTLGDSTLWNIFGSKALKHFCLCEGFIGMLTLVSQVGFKVTILPL